MYKRILILSLALVFASACSSDKNKPLVFTGTMDANTVRVSAQTPGTVLRLLFDEGTSLRAGDTLVVLEALKLGYQVDQSNSAMEEIEKQYQAAVSQMKAGTINRNNIKAKYDRFLSLLKSGAVTQQTVDDLKTQLDAANEQLHASASSLEAFAKKKSQVQAGKNVIEKQIRDASVSSPISGTVLVRYTDKGELLGLGSPVCEIADLSSLWTKIYIAEQQLPIMKLGQKVKIKVDGIADKTFEGTLTWISDKSEFTPKTILTEETRTTLVYPAKVTVDNKDGLFKMGMPVSVIIERGS